MKVVTGLREVAHVGQILSFNGKVKLDFWKGRCNDWASRPHRAPDLDE